MIFRNGPSTAIIAMKSGNFKVKWFGQANDHVMDWSGCNYKFLTVTQQPARGFKTLEEAIEFQHRVERVFSRTNFDQLEYFDRVVKADFLRAQRAEGGYEPDENFVR